MKVPLTITGTVYGASGARPPPLVGRHFFGPPRKRLTGVPMGDGPAFTGAAAAR